MSDKVVSIKGGEIENERRAAFVQAVAASFDLYLEATGVEPEAIVYVLCGLKLPARIAWDIRGDSIGGGSSILSMAAIHCMAEATQRREEI